MNCSQKNTVFFDVFSFIENLSTHQRWHCPVLRINPQILHIHYIEEVKHDILAVFEFSSTSIFSISKVPKFRSLNRYLTFHGLLCSLSILFSFIVVLPFLSFSSSISISYYPLLCRRQKCHISKVDIGQVYSHICVYILKLLSAQNMWCPAAMSDRRRNNWRNRGNKYDDINVRVEVEDDLIHNLHASKQSISQIQCYWTPWNRRIKKANPKRHTQRDARHISNGRIAQRSNWYEHNNAAYNLYKISIELYRINAIDSHSAIIRHCLAVCHMHQQKTCKCMRGNVNVECNIQRLLPYNALHRKSLIFCLISNWPAFVPLNDNNIYRCIGWLAIVFRTNSCRVFQLPYSQINSCV